MNNNYFNPSFMRSTPYMYYPTSTIRPNGFGLFNRIGMGGTPRITFSGILNGASKTLGVINQAIPVFYQVKPIVNNAKTMFKVVRGINSVNTNTNTSNNNLSTVNDISTKKEASNAPTFFQ